MRTIALAARVAIAALLIAGCSKNKLITNGTVVPVAVSITCPGEGIEASIFPYIIQVPEGAQVAWSLVSSPEVPELEIDKKRGEGWPYGGTLPYKGNGKEPAKAHGMKEGQVGKKFSYNITATCTPAGKEPRKIIIDPDMIIVRGGGQTN